MPIENPDAPLPLLLQPPPITLLLIGLAWAAEKSLGPIEVFRSPLLGALLAGVGFLFMMWARLHFMKRKTTLFVGQAASQLVCEGPFRLSRNPMYVGVVLGLAGLGCWMGTAPFFMTAPLAFGVFNFFHIPREERMLRHLFGESYGAYAVQVRRWL